MWLQEPSVQSASCETVVQDWCLLLVHHLQYLFHGGWAPRLRALLARIFRVSERGGTPFTNRRKLKKVRWQN